MPKLAITSDELTYKKDISDLQAGKIMTFIAAESEAVDIGSTRSAQDMPVVPNILSGPQLSVREVLDESGAKTNPQKILAIASYAIAQKNGPYFTPEEVRSLFQKAGEKVPRNFGRDIKDAVGLGYIQETLDSKGEYAITRTGEKMLEEGFASPSRRAVRTGGSNRRARRPNSGDSLRPEVEAIELIAEPDGYSNYHDLSTKTAKIMWLLSYAYSAHQIDSLHPNEINVLATKVRDQIPAKNVSGLMGIPIRKSYVVKTSEGRYKLLEKGDKELQQMMQSKE